MNALWRHLRDRARQGQLSHAQLMELAEATAARQRWDRLQRWLPVLLRSAVAPGERQGSAIAVAAWLQRQRRPDLAQPCLALIDWEAADAQAWLLRGQIAQTLNQRQEAQRFLIRALMLPGGQAIAAYRLGQLHRSIGDFDQAAAWFLASLSADPEPFHIHNELQFTRCSDQLLPDLVAYYSALCRRQPERALPHQLLAHYLMKQGNRAASIAESRKAARLGLGERASLLAPAEAPPTPPDFLIIGVPKGGTTAVLRWLDHQPGLWCHPRKELHFFDGRYSYGTEWYEAQFPRFRDDAAVLRGEATPNYFSHSEAPQRVANLMPAVRAVLLLRNPLQRAISWVQHLQRLEGLEGDVASWLEQELQQLEPLTPEQLAAAPRIGTGALQDSCYDIHLQRWRAVVPDQQLLLVSSDQLFREPAPQLARILSFLGQPANPMPWLAHWRPLNVNPAAPAHLPETLRLRLEHFLGRHCNQAKPAAAVLNGL